ncbi:MAG: hypothetical protein IPO03_21350 [Bacteroidetes bacterium]|nr:hypothetical protein [Bacteroidota bacterium]
MLRYDSLMVTWAKLIKQKGINQITGKIIADASVFEDYATPAVGIGMILANIMAQVLMD